jgi:hypothetical protein
MGRQKVTRKMNDLVRRVYNVDLWDCQSYDQFKKGLVRIMHNLDVLLEAFADWRPSDPRARRAVEDVKLKATRLLRLCREAPSEFEHPEDWRQAARQIIASYEVLRDDAGRLYELMVPRSGYGVLRTAL